MSELLYPTYTVEDSKYQDYVGFIFNGKHSSDLGIVRTSNGSRFDENLLPTIQDKTVQVPGGDGTYFFGSYYTQKQFTIPFAFDSLTEEKFKELKNWLGDKKIHDLIFDEAPYKIYKAKVTGSATIKHIPFMELNDNGDEIRIYKGEGSIQFTCYQPYAKSRFKKLVEIYKKDEEGKDILDQKGNKILDHYEIPFDSLVEEYGNYSNINEWKIASGILGESKYKNYDVSGANSIKLYNPGCIDSHFKLAINFTGGKIAAGGIELGNSILNWKEFKPKGEDTYVVINTKMNLIEGYNVKNKKTGEIYNEYITSGTFFKIPMCSEEDEITMTISTSSKQEEEVSSLKAASIEYDYYYL